MEKTTESRGQSGSANVCTVSKTVGTGVYPPVGQGHPHLRNIPTECKKFSEDPRTMCVLETCILARSCRRGCQRETDIDEYSRAYAES